MKLLIVASTHLELEPFKRSIVPATNSENNFRKYFFKGIEIDVLITGVGMVATAFQLGKLFSESKYDLVINAGLCGAFKKSLRIGEVVNVTTDSFPELGAEDGEKFISLFDLKLCGDDEIPFSDKVLKNQTEIKSKLISSLKSVSGITVNTVQGNEDSIRKLLKRANPDVESMEGGAFFYSCLMNNIPCVQIRVVSNYVEKRNRDAWNIPLATENLAKVLLQILNEY